MSQVFFAVIGHYHKYSSMLYQYTKATHTNASLTAAPVKAPFGYYGAKLRIARKILQLIPPHNAWVEGFCGSAALTLAKAPSPIEVINDVDGQIVNLFEQLRNNSKALCEAVALTPYSRQEFTVARGNQRVRDPLERARRFLITTMMTVNATHGPTGAGFSYTQSYAREGKEARVNRWYNLPARLEAVVERLRGIRIENRDACELVEMFSDRPATLLYLDPPYFVKRRHEYVIDANDMEFHTHLLNICRKARCMILVSAYENSLYKKVLRKEDGWERRIIATHTRDTAGKNYSKTEVLWMNAQLIKAKAAGRVPIRLKKEERRDNKINPPRSR